MAFIEQMGQFLLNHWMLSSALLMILILLFIEDAYSKTAGGKLSPQGLTQLVNSGQAVLVDIRDTESFTKGHLVGAINIPQPAVMQNVDKLKKSATAGNKSLVLIDHTGNQAPLVATKLRKHNLRIHCLHGGIASWREAGLPLTSLRVADKVKTKDKIKGKIKDKI